MTETLDALLMHARHLLGLTQERAGDLIGASKRTIQRYDAHGWPTYQRYVETFARAVFPKDPVLAKKLAIAGGTTLDALGLVDAATQAPTSEHLIDSVLCVAGDAIEFAPRAVEPAVLAAFTRARELGFSIVDVEKALIKKRAARPTTAKGAR